MLRVEVVGVEVEVGVVGVLTTKVALSVRQLLDLSTTAACNMKGKLLRNLAVEVGVV